MTKNDKIKNVEISNFPTKEIFLKILTDKPNKNKFACGKIDVMNGLFIFSSIDKKFPIKQKNKPKINTFGKSFISKKYYSKNK